MSNVETNFFCGCVKVDTYGVGIYLQGTYTYLYKQVIQLVLHFIFLLLQTHFLAQIDTYVEAKHPHKGQKEGKTAKVFLSEYLKIFCE